MSESESPNGKGHDGGSHKAPSCDASTREGGTARGTRGGSHRGHDNDGDGDSDGGKAGRGGMGDNRGPGGNGLNHHHRSDPVDPGAERRTRLVVGLTLVVMVVEIVAGWTFGSLALLADGWHMGSHAAALGIALFAYAYARRHAANSEFSFGTGKVASLGGFTSAIALLVVALFMVHESIDRLMNPVDIQFQWALIVAFMGLVVNLVSASLLIHNPFESHGHGRGHGHDHSFTEAVSHLIDSHRESLDHMDDQTLRGAYFHVLADALTSVTAIAALSLGLLAGWEFLDPVMGLVGAAVIGYWSVGLIRDTSGVLLDRDPNPTLTRRIREKLERANITVLDLHVWRLAPGRLAGSVSLVGTPEAPDGCPNCDIRELLAEFDIEHLVVEAHGHEAQ